MLRNGVCTANRRRDNHDYGKPPDLLEPPASPSRRPKPGSALRSAVNSCAGEQPRKCPAAPLRRTLPPTPTRAGGRTGCSVGRGVGRDNALGLLQLASCGQSGALALAQLQPSCLRTHANPLHGASERRQVRSTLLAVAHLSLPRSITMPTGW